MEVEIQNMNGLVKESRIFVLSSQSLYKIVPGSVQFYLSTGFGPCKPSSEVSVLYNKKNFKQRL